MSDLAHGATSTCARDTDSLRTLLVEVYDYIKPPAPGEKILIKSPYNPKVTLKRRVVGHTIDRFITHVQIDQPCAGGGVLVIAHARAYHW